MHVLQLHENACVLNHIVKHNHNEFFLNKFSVVERESHFGAQNDERKFNFTSTITN